MRVLLISANTETINMVPLPLGLNCIAVAAGSAGHDVEPLDLMGSGDNDSIIREAIRRFTPDVIGMSIRNIDDQKMDGTRFLLEPVRDAVACCHACSGAPVVVGGAGFSIFPDAVLRYVGADMGICGEGEAAFIALLDALGKGADVTGIPGVCTPGHPVAGGCADRMQLDTLPLPDPTFWHLPHDAGELWIPYQTRRGCPMKCSYCSTPALEGTTIRKRSTEMALEGLARHVAAGFDRFYFVDNTFNFPPEYAKQLCSAIIQAKLPIRWRGILYPGAIDEELVGLMAQAGCVEVSLGFESGSLPVLHDLNKKYTPDQVREASHLLGRAGIRRMGFLLLGGPAETKETVRESLAFADSLKLDMLKLSVGIRIYPGTALERTAREEGVIAPGDDLLMPRFYLKAGLEEWLVGTTAEWMADRPYCTT